MKKPSIPEGQKAMLAAGISTDPAGGCYIRFCNDRIERSCKI